MKFFNKGFFDSVTVTEGHQIFYKKQDKLYFDLSNTRDLSTTGRSTTKNIFLTSGGVHNCTLIIIKDRKHETYRFFHISRLDNIFETNAFKCEKDQQEKYRYDNDFHSGSLFVTLIPFYYKKALLSEWTAYKEDSELSIIIIRNKNQLGEADWENKDFQTVCNIIKKTLPYKLGEKIKHTHYINSDITANDKESYLKVTLSTNNDSLILKSINDGEKIEYKNVFEPPVLNDPINSGELINLPELI